MFHMTILGKHDWYLPQGSCLSPILYFIFVNSITETAAKNISECVNKLEEWCRRWHVTLRPIKSQDTNEGRSRSRRPVYRYCPAGLLQLVGLRDSRLGQLSSKWLIDGSEADTTRRAGKIVGEGRLAITFYLFRQECRVNLIKQKKARVSNKYE